MNTIDAANIVMPLVLTASALYGTFAIKKALKNTKGEPGEPGFTGAMGIMGEPAKLLNIVGVLNSLPELNGQTNVNHLDTFLIRGEYWVYIDRSDMDPQYNAASYRDGMFHFCGFVDGTDFSHKTGELSFMPFTDLSDDRV